MKGALAILLLGACAAQDTVSIEPWGDSALRVRIARAGQTIDGKRPLECPAKSTRRGRESARRRRWQNIQTSEASAAPALRRLSFLTSHLARVAASERNR